jgi:hypothetical protein
MRKNKKMPQYSESLLIELIQDTKTLEDLTSLCQLVKELESQKDLAITERICREVKLQQGKIIYGKL